MQIVIKILTMVHNYFQVNDRGIITKMIAAWTDFEGHKFQALFQRKVTETMGIWRETQCPA